MSTRQDKLWYNSPGKDWITGLPTGTGRIAGMVMGYPEVERIALNNEWLWRGLNKNRKANICFEHLTDVRELLINGHYEEATNLANRQMGYHNELPSETWIHGVGAYQPAGDLYYSTGHKNVENYKRELDLSTGMIRITYVCEGISYCREVLSSLALDMIIVRLSAIDSLFDTSFYLNRIYDEACSLSFDTSSDSLVMSGHLKEDINFGIRVHIVTNDTAQKTVRNNTISINNAEEILLFIDINVKEKPEAKGLESINKLKTSDWDSIVKAHLSLYEPLYKSAELQIDGPLSQKPTDARLKDLGNNNQDKLLPVLYFNYGRYLLISSNANAELPATLQGKWNEDLTPPWDSDYHMDINLEMTYWAAETGNLAPLVNPLIKFIQGLVPGGKLSARNVYGCKGVFFPITEDCWMRSCPACNGWDIWIGAAPWLAQHLWWHYEFSLDEEYLRNTAYPIIKEIAQFYEDYLVKDKNGIFQIVPSQSPENSFKTGGSPVSLCISSAMDIALANDLLSHAVLCSQILHSDADKREKWMDILSHLPTYKISKTGRIVEWNEDFVEIDPGHRHLSNLFAFYPGDQLSPEKTPELSKAVKESLDIRLEKAWKTEFLLAWAACINAKLRLGNSAYDNLVELITSSSNQSLLSTCNCQGKPVFVMDGNIGGSEAIIEMLLQSYHEEIRFLPALPDCWPDGKVSGLCARGGFVVDIEWKNLKLEKAVIKPSENRLCTIMTSSGFSNKNNIPEILSSKGEKVDCFVDVDKLQFNAVKGESYQVIA